MSSCCESLGSTLSSTGEVLFLSDTSAGSAFIGGSLTVGATLLLFCELILFGVGPDLLGFAVDGLGLGLTGAGVSSALGVSPYLTPVLTLRDLLPVQCGVWVLLEWVKCSPTGRSEAAVGGTLKRSSAKISSR